MKILITGGASGIGYKVAMLLSKRNDIYLTTHTDSQCQNITNKLVKHPNIDCFKLDINKDLDKIDKLDIDCLISFSAVGIGGSVLGMDIKYLYDSFETNFFSNIKLVKKVYNKMEKQGNGKIFVCSSLASYLPIPMLGSYCSSKAALSIMLDIMNKELKVIKSNVSISIIEPGAYYTGFNQVMIDNKENNLNKQQIFYHQKNKFTKIQKIVFNLIEKRKASSIICKIVKEVDKKNPKIYIRAPFFQKIGMKLYFLFFR